MTARAHADARRTLAAFAAHTADDPDQERLRREFLDFLAAEPAGTSRTGPVRHLTAGVLVMDPTGARVLLTHHRKAGAWYQFGGHIEDTDATVREAAARELAEESGLDGLSVSEEPVHLDRHFLPAAFGTCREHLDVRYVAVAPTGAVPAVSAESHDVRWFAVEDLPPRTAADLHGLIEGSRRVIGGKR